MCIQRICAHAFSFMTACGVVEPAVLSIDCYFESPADGTAVSLRDRVFGNLCHSQAGWGVEGHRGILGMLFPLYMISFEGLTAT